MPRSSLPNVFARLWWLAILVGLPGTIDAQSLDLNAPSPVSSDQVVGRIAARDIGDARLTNHYYIFAGTPGDLILTIESTNLNGDVDVFTAGTLRPVLKFALYAELTQPVAKGIYLRQRQEMVLRVQARSPNDDDGIYRLRFSGSFERLMPGSEIAEAETPEEDASTVRSTDRRIRRVNSAGARIDEPPAPPAEVAAAPTPKPTPERPPEIASTAGGAEKPVEVEPIPKAAEKRTRSSPRNTRVRRPVPKKTPEKTVEEAKSAPGEPANEETPRAPKKDPKKKVTADEAADTIEAPPKSSAKTAGRRATKPTEPVPAAQPVEPTGPKLLIELMDGTRIERFMSTVRRLTVESGQIIVTGTDGKVERVRLASVLKMSIGQ